MIRSVIAFVVAVGLPQAVGITAAWVTIPAVRSWYPTLTKPWFTPPNWLFGPAWTTLYLAMGIASFLVWREGISRPEVRLALAWYAAQLVLNGLWSPAFFGAQSPALGLLVIVPLFASVAVTLIQFQRVSVWAAGLMVPYLLWVGYATALNTAVWWLN